MLLWTVAAAAEDINENPQVLMLGTEQHKRCPLKPTEISNHLSISTNKKKIISFLDILIQHF